MFAAACVPPTPTLCAFPRIDVCLLAWYAIAAHEMCNTFGRYDASGEVQWIKNYASTAAATVVAACAAVSRWWW